MVGLLQDEADPMVSVMKVGPGLSVTGCAAASSPCSCGFIMLQEG